MLQISSETMAAFESATLESFVDQAVSHGRAFDPAGFGSLNLAAMRHAVNETIDIAGRFGVFGKAGTIFFLEARCILGPGFPGEPEHDWARNLLAAEWTDEARTMEYIRDTALEKARARHG